MSSPAHTTQQAFLEHFRDCYLEVGDDWRIVHANPAAASFFKRSPSALAGLTLWSAWPEIVGTPFEEVFRSSASSASVVPFESGFPVDDLWLEGQTLPLGPNLGIVFRDITDRKRTESQLRDQADLVEMSFDAIIVHRNGGEIVYWNRSAERKYGWSREDALGKTIHTLLSTESDTSFEEIYRQVEQTGTWEGELTHTTRDGERKTVSSRWVLRHHVGQPDSILEVNRDITSRIVAEASLRRSEERYRSLMQATHDAVWGTDAEGRTVEEQPLWQSYTGQSPDEYLVDGGFGAVHPDDRHTLAEAFGESMATERPFQHEFRLWSRRYQAYRHVMTKGVPVHNPDGTVREWVGTILDVEDQRRAESELRASEQRARVVMKSARINVFHQDLQLRFTRVDNPLGPFPADQIIGKTLKELIPSEYADRVTALEKDVLADGIGRSGEYRVPLANRDLVVRLVVEPFRGEDGAVTGITGAAVDITSLKQAEENLRASETRYRFLAESTPQLVWTADRNGQIDYVNERWVRYTGRPLERARVEGWSIVLHPDDVERVDQAWQRSLRESADFVSEFRLRRVDGVFRWHLCRSTPMRNEHGAAVRWFGSITDIQALKEAERAIRESNERLEEAVHERTSELEAANRELEGFTYSVSHDLRAPLRAIGSLGRILIEDYSESLPPEATRILERQGAAATKLGILIDELLQLSRIRRQSLLVQRFDISAMARDIAAELSEREWRGPIRFNIENGLEAEADPRLIHFVVLNLFENACKFSPQGGTIRFGSKNGAFYVSDEGIGLNTAFADKLWRPFERLVRDSEFPGTGIGLANVHRIVERHNGRIWVESEPGHGATFWFTL